MLNFIQAFWNDEEGAAAIEYGLIAGLIAIVIALAAGAAGESLGNIFESIQAALATADGKVN
jgi:pilus assembly protein Flp/PilA